MAGYIRQSTADIIPTATVRAAPINAEYNALRDAFAASGGHKHDGTTGEGEYVPLIADLDALNKVVIDTTNNRIGFFVEVSSTAVEQVRIQDGAVVPVTDNDIDLGTSSLEFKDLYLDGTAYIDTLAVHQSATITSNLTVNGNTTLGNAASDTITLTGDVASNITPSADSTYDLGAVGSEWRNLYIDGTANIDSLVADTADINAGTIDNTVIGGTTAAAADFTTMDASGNVTVGGTLGVTGATTISSTLGVTGNSTVGGTLGVTGLSTLATVDINGGNIDATAIGSSTASSAVFTNLTASGTVNFAGATVSNLGSVTTAAIGGGTINNSVIGGSTPAAITGTTITSNSGFTGNLSGNVTGDVTGNLTGNVTSTGNSTLNNLTVNGTLDVTNTTIENVSDPTTAQQAATKAYVDGEITSLIGGAPGALDTLNELAAAINDDQNVYTTLTTSIATKLPKAGGTMSGEIAMGDNKITGLATPTSNADAATKLYVDNQTTQAETYAANALASQNAAAASYDAFDDRYLGAKSSDPTVDNDGNALITGALYFDSTNGVMKVYNGSEWANASSSVEGVKANFYYTATNAQTVFSGSDDNSNTLVVDQVGLVNVYMNGVRLHEDDYTISAGGNSVTLATGAATGDLIYLEVFGNFTGQSGAEVAITGGSITGLSALGVAGNASFGDNNKAIFGAGSDLQIYHDGSNSFISDQGTGNLRILAQDFRVVNSANSETMIQANVDADVRLYYDSAPKLATTSTGISVTGDATFADNGKAIFGAGSDLQIYHDGTNSYIDEVGAGVLKIRSNGTGVDFESTGGETLAQFVTNGAATLYYNNAPTLATTSTGVDITGTLTSDNIQAGSSSAVATDINLIKASSGAAAINFQRGGNPDTDFRIILDSSENVNFDWDYSSSIGADRAITFTAEGAAQNLLKIETTGDISFYEDTGTTPKFFWSAADERLGIGTDSPSFPLSVQANSSAEGLLILGRSSDDISEIAFRENDNSTALGELQYRQDHAILRHRVGDLRFATGGTSERMRIDSSGNVGIGSASDGAILQLDKASSSYFDIQSDSTLRTRIYNDSSQTILETTTNNLIFKSASSEAMRIDSSGNVGIGNTSSGYLFTSGETRLAVGDGSEHAAIQIYSGTAKWGGLEFADDATNGTGQGFIGYYHPSDYMQFNTSGSEAMRIDSSGNVGIGTDSPSHPLTIQADGTSGNAVKIIGDSTNSSGRILWRNSADSSVTAEIEVNSSEDMLFGTGGGTEAMRIDSSGNLLVGKTSTALSTTGSYIAANGLTALTTDSQRPLILNRKTNDGDLIEFNKDGAPVGSIACNSDTSNNYMIIGKGAVGLQFARDADADNIMPARPDNQSLRDNAIDLGSGSFRFDDIYATNGTIQTSDANEKQDIAELSDAEQRVAVAAKGLLRKFRWRDAVAEKGDEARTHFGIIAQDLQAAFAAEGLDAGDYAMFISSTWTDEETGEERTRMGVRYSELLAFIIAAI